MAVRMTLSPAVVEWALKHAAVPADRLAADFDVERWLTGEREPTVNQIERFAKRAGLPFGYLLLEQPPELRVPIPDFRVGFDRDLQEPSANLLAVLHQSMQRQDWYREYAEVNDLPRLNIVGRASDWTAQDAAADMRSSLGFEVTERAGSWDTTRKNLLKSFEQLGGLCVVTSMVGNNTKRTLDSNEFRGFTLVDALAPLIFVNANQTLNGQLFTLAHEMAHVWRGESGISNEDARVDPDSDVERWCNVTASEFLVPSSDLLQRAGNIENLVTPEALDALASVYRCGTLVVLQALRRVGLVRNSEFDDAYSAEERRLDAIAKSREGGSGGGDFYNNQPFRIGERLSRAVISDAREGRTPFAEAMHLLSLKSPATFDEYASRLGA